MYESVFSHYYSIDIETEIVQRNDDLVFLQNVEQFVKDKMSGLYFSNSNRLYKIKSPTTEVISSIGSMITEVDVAHRSLLGETIAKRLLGKEKDAQARITHLEQDVQKGGLVITCFKKDHIKYFAIVKIHYIDFYEENTFEEQRGLPKKDVILKTSVCRIDDDDIIDDDFYLSDSTKPKGQGAAKFWWDDFLELAPLINDADNTKAAFTKVDGFLSQEFKEDRESYWYFRNNLVSYLRSEDEFVFNTMVERTIGTLDIEPLNGVDELEKEFFKENLETKIRALQLKQGVRQFDTEFTIDKKEVKARVKRKIALMPNVDLDIKGEIPDFKNSIQTGMDGDKKFLKIYTDAGYDVFKNPQ